MLRGVFVCGLALVITLATAIVVAPRARAYGTSNWQVAFSGNFNNKSAGGNNTGFWGWCAFIGVSSGAEADCQFTEYIFNATGANSGALFTFKIKGTAWDMEPPLVPAPFPLPPGFPTKDFFITAGTVTLTGPTIAQIIASGPPPPGSECTATGSTAMCPIPVLEAVGLYSPDTGIPAGPGHFSLKSIFEFLGVPVPPGAHVDIQVTKVG